MPEDWFKQNAPKSGDWFQQNAPAATPIRPYDPATRGDRMKGTVAPLPETFMGTLAGDFAKMMPLNLGDEPPSAMDAVRGSFDFLPGVAAARGLAQIPGVAKDIYEGSKWGKGAAKLLEAALPFAGEVEGLLPQGGPPIPPLTPAMKDALWDLVPFGYGKKVNAIRKAMTPPPEAVRTYSAPPVTYPKPVAGPPVFPAPPVTYPATAAEAAPKVYPAPRVTYPAPEPPPPSYPAPAVTYPAPEAGPRPVPAPPVRFPKPPAEVKPKVYPAPRVTFPRPPVEAEAASETAGALPKTVTDAQVETELAKMRAQQRPPREPMGPPPDMGYDPLTTPAPERVAAPGLPPPPEAGGRLYSKTKNPHQEITSQIHAQGREMELPGSPAGKKISVGPTAQEVYGKSWPELDIEQKSAINEFLQTHRRLPVAADVVSGLFRK